MRNLVEFLEETCKTKGGFLAVEGVDDSLTFAELRQNALMIGKRITSIRGCGCEKKMIAIYLPKGIKFICAMLGVLYSGNVYVPMDCRAPIKRTKLIFDIVQPILIITDTSGKKSLIEAGVAKEILIACDDMHEPENTMDDFKALVENTLSQIQDIDPAYLLFTSGSTGIPKGVVIPHNRVIGYIEWAQAYFSVTDNEIIANQAPFYFTVSVMDIFLSLATGSKLCIVPENLFSKPDKLLEFLNERKVTLIFWVSSVYHHIAQAGALDRILPKSLKRAWFVGEPMAVQSLKYWLKSLPEVEFTNLYGSTETDMTICYRIPKDFSSVDTVPLGHPCANTEILLLDNDLVRLVNPGEIGEICVRGSCLALGYYKDAEKTQASFIQNPLHNDYRDLIYKTGDLGEIKDALIFFHGRRDHQFKHLGYRIEAGEIEAIAMGFPGVKNNCVLFDSDKRQIVLFYTSDEQINELEYRRMLMADLPVYMVPTRFVRLDVMPLNANSKKDRIQLKKQYIEGST